MTEPGPEYDLTITRRVPNPVFVPERVGGYDQRESNQREPYLLIRTLSVMVSDAEFEAIKRALIQHWS